MRDLRVRDIIDDLCVKCGRLTNHAMVSLMTGAAAKVRWRTCYSDHDYRIEIAPPTKKELLKQKELYEAVLAGVAPVEAVVEAVGAAGPVPLPDGAAAPPQKKKTKSS